MLGNVCSFVASKVTRVVLNRCAAIKQIKTLMLTNKSAVYYTDSICLFIVVFHLVRYLKKSLCESSFFYFKQ